MDMTTVCRMSGIVVIESFRVPEFLLGVVVDKEQGCAPKEKVVSESDSTRRGGGQPKGVRPCNAG